MTSENVSISDLLTHPSNVSRLAALIHNEQHNPVSALHRYARMTTPAPPITIAPDGTVLDGCHRLAVAAMAGHTHIEAHYQR